MSWSMEAMRWTVYLGFPLASMAVTASQSMNQKKRCAERVAHFERTGEDPQPKSSFSLTEANLIAAKLLPQQNVQPM